MLYVSTRMKQDAFTAARAMSEDRCPGGGFFVPLRLPEFDEKQIKAMGENTFSQNAAQIVNLLFGTQLDSWGIEFAIGRYPVKLVNIGSREIIAETWHNPAWRFERLARGIEKAIRQSDKVCPEPTDWLLIGSRIAVLFGIFGELMHDGTLKPGCSMDVALPGGNFSAPMAAWYARQMGLPISTILCCCNENNGLWKLLHKGELRTDAPTVATMTPLCDHSVPEDLERLIFGTLGQNETMRFCETLQKGGSYYLEPHQLSELRRGLYVSVVGRRRMEATIPNLYKTSGYIADPYTALCYSGVMDYRSSSGESRQALILSEESPAHSFGYVAKCMGISSAELKNRINNS